MTTLAFKTSANLTIGVELELQLINPASYDLSSCATNLLRNIQHSPYSGRIKPEITQSMIEINSSIHQNPVTLLTELTELRDFLTQQAQQLNFAIAGGGTHPFQRWSAQAIFPARRFRTALHLLGYIAKNYTVFGLHIHLGCASADDAIYLAHMLTIYVPHLIALSASSPYYQAVDTSHNSARVSIIKALPQSGTMPYVTDWAAFKEYFNRMLNLGIIESIKDLHWDIRPQAGFGTVEVRICDMPLTLHQTVALTAYTQTLAHYLLTERPLLIKPCAYDIYKYNRYQAGRFGFLGNYIDPITEQRSLIKEAILTTIKQLKASMQLLNTEEFIEQLATEVSAGKNDASWLREIFKKVGALDEVVRRQCCLWKGEF